MNDTHKAAVIIARIERETGTKPADILSKSKLKEHAEARHLALYCISLVNPKWKCETVTKSLRMKEHSSLSYARRAVLLRMSDSPATCAMVSRILDGLMPAADMPEPFDYSQCPQPDMAKVRAYIGAI